MNAADQADYGPSWYSATMVPARDRGPLVDDLDVDVCVIGAGLAGLTAAHELARRGWSVGVLESRRVAWNASGRNAGFVLPGFAVAMDQVVSRVGLDHAKALWSLSEMGLEYVRSTIRETRMPGVAPADGWLKVSKVDKIEEAIADLKLYGQDLGATIEGWPTERVRDVLHSRHYFHAMHFPRAFHMHPLNYALGLAAAAEAAGARIFEGTSALSIDPDGVRKRVTTPKARVRASHIVLACNVHLGALMPRAAGTLLPAWSYLITTAPLGPRLLDAIRYRGAVSDTDLADNHYRIVDGDRLLWSGRSTTWEADPRRFADKLKADIAEVYPQIGGVEVEHVWSGVLGSALHRMPQLGELSPGLWMASGFGGHGLNTTAMAGVIIARGVAEADDTWRLFSPYEFVWAGGKLGRAVKQVYYWWFHARERFEARQARDREEEFNRGGAAEPRGRDDREVQTSMPQAPMPAEPVPADLPADPVMADVPVPVAPPMTRAADEAFDQSDEPPPARVPADGAVAGADRIVRLSRPTRPAASSDEVPPDSNHDRPDNNRGSRGRSR